jgi:hypothetical protein
MKKIDQNISCKYNLVTQPKIFLLVLQNVKEFFATLITREQTQDKLNLPH